jgi:ribokinase
MNKVLVTGSINMDVIATAERHPQSGETVPGKELHFLPGGKGANQAVAAAKLGAETVMIGKLGNDVFADELDHFLREQGIDLAHVSRTSKAATGTALIVVAESDNTIVVVPGANGLVDGSEIDRVSFAKGDILLSQFEVPFEAIERFFTIGKAAGAKAILNPAPAKPGCEHLLALADILVVNETELAFFVGEKEIEGESIPKAAIRLRKNEEQVIIVTLGAKGAFVLNGDRCINVTGHTVPVIDTTGAGDCFVGALASEFARGGDLESAVDRANVAASICVQRLGAGPSMPTATEVDLAYQIGRSTGAGG